MLNRIVFGTTVFIRFSTILFLHERRCYQYIIESKIKKIHFCSSIFKSTEFASIPLDKFPLNLSSTINQNIQEEKKF